MSRLVAATGVESINDAKRNGEEVNTIENRPHGGWDPSVWEPKYEMMLQDHLVNNMSQAELALKYNFARSTVSLILNSTEAQRYKQKLLKQIREKSQSVLENKISAIIEKSVSNVHEVIHNEDLMAVDPFKMFDKSVSALKGFGAMRDGSSTNVVQNNVQQNQMNVINPDHFAQLLDGINKLNKVNELHTDVTGDSID